MTEPSSPTPVDDLSFRFEPCEPGLSGTAFSTPFKVMTWSLCLGLLIWMIRLELPWGHSGTTWAWTAWVMLAYSSWVIQRSRLHVHSDHISQDWIWSKRMETADLVFIQVIRIPWFEWLLAPRVYARSFQGKAIFFYCADRRVLAELSRMTEAHKAWFEQRLSGPG